MATTNPPVKVNNMDIAGLYQRIQRFMSELWKSSSADATQFLAADLTRLNSYLKSLVGYTTWVTAQPQLDLPMVGPRDYTLDPVPATAGGIPGNL